MKLLRIDSSPMGDGAISRRLTNEFLEQWLRKNPEGAVIARDLARTAIPVVDASWVQANYPPKEMRTPQQVERLRVSSQLIAELQEADEYVIGMPMHNWGPPARFKLWVDQIVTPSTCLQRPLTGKRGTFIIAAGRIYAPGSPDAHKNYLLPWLQTLFELLGAREMRFVFADGTKRIYNGDVDREAFLAAHVAEVRSLFGNGREYEREEDTACTTERK